MKQICLILLIAHLPFLSCNSQTGKTQNETPAIVSPSTDSIPENVKILMKYYPQITSFKDNQLFFQDGSFLLYDDGIKDKSTEALINSPDIEDQFFYPYSKGEIPLTIQKDFDPGRIRNEAFFKKIYGNTQEQVKNKLVEVVWCPKLIGQKILVTQVNGINKIVEEISAELDELPEYKDYIKNIGGTFNWRLINGTTRLSMHSFGMTIDINTSFSHYWQWDCKCTDEKTSLSYHNKIPQKIIDIFEKHGFIWGGKWYHYDTMHFEYRPELLHNQ